MFTYCTCSEQGFFVCSGLFFWRMYNLFTPIMHHYTNCDVMSPINHLHFILRNQLIICRYFRSFISNLSVSVKFHVINLYTLPASVMPCILWNEADEGLISCYMYCPCCCVPNWHHIYRNHICYHLSIIEILLMFCFVNWLFALTDESYDFSLGGIVSNVFCLLNFKIVSLLLSPFISV